MSLALVLFVRVSYIPTTTNKEIDDGKSQTMCSDQSSALLWIERERKTSRGCAVMWIKRVAGQTLFSSQRECTYSYVRTGSYYESKSFKATCLFPSCGCWDGEHWIPNPFFRRLKTTGRGQKSRQFMEEALSSYNHDHHGDSSSPVCLPPPAYVLHLECG